MEIVVIGPKAGETKVMKDDGSGFTQEFLKRTFVKNALGPEAKSLIAQKNKEIREETKIERRSLIEAEKQQQKAEKLASEREKADQEVQNLRTKREQTQAKIDSLVSSHENEAELRRLQQLRKNLEIDLDNAKKEVAALEKLAKKHGQKHRQRTSYRQQIQKRHR